MTAPDELETTLLEWAKGPYRLSRNECDVVMARLAELEAATDPNRNSVFEYMRDADGTVTQIRTVTTTAWRSL